MGYLKLNQTCLIDKICSSHKVIAITVDLPIYNDLM